MGFIISNILCTIFFSIYAVSLDYSNIPITITSGILSQLARIFGVFCLLFFQIWRLRYSFEGTSYEVNKKTVTFLIVLTIITVIASCCAFFTSIFYVLHRDITILFFLIAISVCFSDIMICIVPIWTTFLFSQNLLKLAISVRQSEMSGVCLTERQETLLQTIAKQTLLVSIMSVLIIFSALFYGLYIIDYGNYNINYAMLSISFLILSIYGIISPLCMWFSFVFASNKYYLCCSKGHTFCLKLHQHRALKTLTELSVLDEKQDTSDQYTRMVDDNQC